MRKLSAGAAIVAIVLLPLGASAHPLGNFTTNQYVGLYVTPESVAVDYVLDLAEVPTSQQRRAMDEDADDELSEDEIERFADTTCTRMGEGVTVSLGGALLDLEVVGSNIAFPQGEASLPTLRLECRLQREVAISGPVALEVVNNNFSNRVGWKEMTIGGEDLSISGLLPTTSVTERLTAYPENLLSSPVEIRTAVVELSPGDGIETGAAPPPVGTSAAMAATPVDSLASLIDPAAGTPALPLAMMVAVGLGFLHALAPGHGKTVMAAYLVGSRGTARQAVVLGLAVAASHTVGVLALGAVTLLGTSAFAPEAVFPVLSTISGVIVIGIGVWLLWKWARHRNGEHHHHEDDNQHGHDHEHGHDHHVPDKADTGRQGWKVLASMGLVGGLVPSTSAVVLLLAAVNLGRIPIGLLLIALFGLGMAATLVGVGFAFVKASDAGLSRFGTRRWVTRARSVLTPLAGIVVVTIGVFLTLRP